MKNKLIALLILQLMLLLPVYTAEALSISDVRLVNFEDASTSVQWETDEAANATVLYGLGTLIDSGISGNILGRQHYLTFPTRYGENYSYIVESCTTDECVKSERGEFTAGEDQEPPFLNLTVPSVTSENRIDIYGSTEPFSEVRIYMNGQIQRVLRSTDTGDGNIRLIGLALPTIDNVLTIKVEDPAGNEYEKTYPIRLDTKAPEISLYGFKDVVTDPSFVLSGEVDEFSDIEIFVGLSQDSVPPGRVQGLRITPPVGQNVVTLEWDRPSADDLLEYIVYRNDKKIAVVNDEEYQDVQVSSGAGYSYRISAVDTSCNEGPLSDTEMVQTATGGKTDFGEITPIESTCKDSDAVISTDGSWSQGVQLVEGPNEIRIVARDRAGNVFVYENTTYYDATGPVIEEHNLEGITPSYAADVVVSGKVSEPATVFVMLEGETEPLGYGQTDATGEFSVPAKLTRKIKETASQTGTEYSFGGGEEGYRNNIYLRAVDRAGREDTTGVVPVIYAQCGFGNWFDVQISNPTPSTVNPRLLLEGMGTFSFNIELEYLGPETDEVQLDKPAFHTMALSRDELAKYDNVPPPQERWTNDYKKGYVQFTIPTPSFPETDPEHPNGWTQVQKELNISENRRGECKMPGMGCYKIPMQLEIQFTKIMDRLPGETIVTGVAGPRAERITQRICVPIEIAIDQRIDTSVLPNSFLRNSAKFFDEALNVIDSILDPIEKIYDITYYLYLGGTVVNFFQDMATRTACREGVLGVVQRLQGGGFQREVAQSGLCNVAYGEDEGVLDACLKCQAALNKKKEREQRIQMIGDRLFCPAAPSLQKYIDDAQTQGVEQLKIGEQEYYIGNDCASLQLTSAPTGDGKKGIDKIYEDFTEHKTDRAEGDASFDPKNINCANQHPATPECCGYTYDKEWGTACSIFKPNYEITESKILAEQQSTGRVNPRRFSSARSGLCSAEGNIEADFVRTNLLWLEMSGDEREEYEEKEATSQDYRIRRSITVGGERKSYNDKLQNYLGNPTGRTMPYISELDDKRIYIVVEENQKGEPVVWRGYKTTEASMVTAPSIGRTSTDRVEVGSSSYIVKFKPGEDLSFFFKAGDSGVVPPYSQIKSQWEEYVCGGNCNDDDLQAAYNGVRSKIGSLGQDYIVDPMEDIASSFKCGCIVGMRNHLKVWRNMLGAVRNCFKSIEVTGDGTAGACQAVMSRFVCDTIYSVIKCYRARSGITSSERPQGTFSGIGGIGQSIARSGVSAQQTMNARYGGNNLFRAGFSEEKIVNSMCLFAFTGDWSLDPQALLEIPEAQAPVGSQPFLFPCERRFIGFDIATTPPGLTIWNYHVGVDLFAGADLRYSLELVCSDDYSCDPNEGYVGGKCDCVGIGEKTQIIPLGTGALKQFDNIGEAGDVYETVQGPYRYDKARLKWNWRGKNNQVERDEKLCTFQTQGGGPEAFCAWDILTNTFRCSSEVFEDYYARFVREPLPQYTESNNPVFGIGEAVKFEVPIVQRIPDTASCAGGINCEEAKYLIYNVYNQYGTLIWTNDPSSSKITETNNPVDRQRKSQAAPLPMKPLATNGERAYVIDFGPLVENYMNLKGGINSVPYDIKPIRHSSAVRAVDYTSSTLNQDIVMIINGRTKRYSVHEKTEGQDTAEEFAHKTGTPLRVGMGTEETDNYLFSFNGIEVRIDDAFFNENGGEMQIYIKKSSNPVEVKPVCDIGEESMQNKMYNWRASFEIREPESFGIGAIGPGSQISVVQGQKQEYPSISFTVGCGNAQTGLRAAGATPSKVICEENVEDQVSCLCTEDPDHEVDARNMDSNQENWREKYKDELCGRIAPGNPGDVCIDGQCRQSDVDICQNGEEGPCICYYEETNGDGDYGWIEQGQECEVVRYTQNEVTEVTPKAPTGLVLVGSESEYCKTNPFPQGERPVPSGHKAPVNKQREILNYYRCIIEKYSRERQLDPSIVAAKIHTESTWNDKDISPTGYVGLMQVGAVEARGANPTSEEAARIDENCKPDNCNGNDIRFDPVFNIRAGTNTYLSKRNAIQVVYDTHHSDGGTYTAIFNLTNAAYNMGQTPVIIALEALQQDGVDNPTWDEVFKEIKGDSKNEILNKVPYRDRWNGKMQEVESHIKNMRKHRKTYYDLIIQEWGRDIFDQLGQAGELPQ